MFQIKCLVKRSQTLSVPRLAAYLKFSSPTMKTTMTTAATFEDHQNDKPGQLFLPAPDAEGNINGRAAPLRTPSATDARREATSPPLAVLPCQMTTLLHKVNSLPFLLPEPTVQGRRGFRRPWNARGNFARTNRNQEPVDWDLPGGNSHSSAASALPSPGHGSNASAGREEPSSLVDTQVMSDPRRSDRTSRRPPHLEDFVTYLTE
ncbi:uncharacterized protein [Erythrolamprus reginae]|uniref:uncharacterized protein isoform X1 n=1 Tax=Erythrolamprus reginae TaxID=121349 RepID=UPI00396CF28C